jgi:hypothetical protein
MTLRYLTIDQLIERIEQPYRSKCRRILEDNRLLFETAQGSTHNHQAWPGGYIDHITDGLNFVRHLYAFMSGFGRPLPFSCSDALFIFYLHDLEKPWRIKIRESGAYNAPGLETKEQFKAFREAKLVEYGITLNSYLMNALTYVEGEYKDYSSKRRVMNELAAFCHMADNWCARGWHNYPKLQDDEWIGAARFRTKQA